MDWSRLEETRMRNVRRAAMWLRPWDRTKDVRDITDGQDHLPILQGPVIKI